MDLSSQDHNGLTATNFDMEILMSMANTDLLIRLIKNQTEEISMLKSQLSSFNASAMQMTNCYTAEKKKNDQIAAENRTLQLRLQTLEEKVALLNNNLLNNTSIHEQIVAEFEDQITEKADICRQLIHQGNVLKANKLSSREIQNNCSNAKEWLRRRGEVFEDVKVTVKKKVNAATMTDVEQSEKEKKKTFCNKSTMYSPRKSTATRGTTTSSFIQKVDVGTNHPEPLQVEEILSLMIDNLPPMITPVSELPVTSTSTQTELSGNLLSIITPVSELPLMSTSTQTKLSPKSRCHVGTVTRLKNVRRRITYNTDQSESTLNAFFRVKKEKEDSSSDTMSSWEYPHQGNSPVNPKLADLWQIVGQMIFSIIGNGEVFARSNNFNLISDNLNQIRRVFEMSHVNDTNDFADHHFNAEVDVAEPVFASVNDFNRHNSTITSFCSDDPPDVLTSESSTNTTQNICPLLPLQQSLQNSNISSCSTIYKRVPKSPEIVTKSTVVQNETEAIFKVPTSGTKRKATSESFIRKRTCPMKITMKTVEKEADKPKKKKSFLLENISNIVHPVEQLPSFIDDDSDAAFVEDILKYFKMPKLIEPIIDPEFIIQVYKKSDEAGKRTLNDGVDSEMSLTEVPLAEKSDETNECTLNDSVDSVMPLSEVPSTEEITYDEFDSPASPPPFSDNTTANRPPSIIPLSSNTFNESVVKSILAKYDTNKRLKVTQRKFTAPTTEEEQMLAASRNRIERYLISEWNVNEINACCSDLSNTRPSILSKCIIEIIMNTKDENVSVQYTPPAPALPPSHQKIIVLIKRISRQINGFEDLVLFQLEKALFVLAGEQVSINEAINLTHLFIGLADSIDRESKWSCVLFMYKSLYYFSFKALPMVYTVLMAYPAILPKFQDGDDIANFLMTTDNLMQATFMIVLINTNLFETAELAFLNNGLKKKELSTLLKKYYHFPLMQPTIDEFVDHLVNRLRSTCNDFQNISYSIILLAKRKGTVWADDVIQRKLLPLLNDYLSTISEGSENDERLITLVSAISSIVKTYPVTKDISNYQQIFNTILNSTTRQTIQETAVMALLRTSRFGMVDVYQRIRDWEPSFLVDIDEDLLVRNLFKAEPLISDYLRERENKLLVDVYCGSIDTENDCLLNTDVVIGIEIIEHLYPETLENVPYNIFGFMKPKIALFTTPNSDCNVLFKMTEKFRHYDHKFEWSREQFEDWGHNICERFPDYKVAFYGIGPGPTGYEELGCCSQMALFIREDFLELTSQTSDIEIGDKIKPLNNANEADQPTTCQIRKKLRLDVTSTECNVKSSQNSKDDGVSLSEDNVIDDMTVEFAKSHIDNMDYRLIKSCVYPKNMDERTLEQQIYDEACFHLARYQNLDDDHYDPSTDLIYVPVQKIFNLVYKYTVDIDEFRSVMRKFNYTINEDDIFVIKPIESDSEDENDVDYHEPGPEAIKTVRDCEVDEEEDWD